MNKPELIKKIKSIDTLSNEEKTALIELISHNKRYGLVWENKTEYAEELLRDTLPVLNEVAEKRITGKKQENKNAPDLFKNTQPGNKNNSTNNYPNHILIEGDNIHALTALSFTHEGRIDVIYIDPPYNTGNNDFSYNDDYVDREDNYRHSKWLSFMNKRLKIAKRLLSDNGVIFISIDDNEQAQLKLLCDEIFIDNNFISEVIIETATDNNPRQIAIEHEYLIAYAKNINLQNKWGIENKGGILIQEEFEKLKELYLNDFGKINIGLKTFIKENKIELEKYKVTHYQFADEKGVYFKGDISNTKPGGYDIDLIHPITNKACKKSPNGYRFKYDTLMKMVEDGDIEFGADEKNIVTVKRRMNEITEKFRSIYYEDGRGATNLLKTIFNKKAFNNPKSILLIERIIKFSTKNKSALILDFFAGSGTTLHATMQLNAEDGGNRQCILVTNNENNICEEVTYERNRRVIEGYTNAKGEKIEGLTENNLRYFKTEFVGRERSLKNKRRITELSVDLLRIKEACYTEINGAKNIRIFNEDELFVVVVADDTAIPKAVELIQQLPEKSRIKVYVFSEEQDPYTEDFYEVLDRVELCALPDAIYKAYQHVLPKKKPVMQKEENLI